MFLFRISLSFHWNLTSLDQHEKFSHKTQKPFSSDVINNKIQNMAETFALNLGFLVGILLHLWRKTERKREGERASCVNFLKSMFSKVASTLPTVAACIIIFFVIVRYLTYILIYYLIIYVCRINLQIHGKMLRCQQHFLCLLPNLGFNYFIKIIYIMEKRKYCSEENTDLFYSCI